MKLATWNVNSLKVRLPQVLDWMATHQPDVLCLQEIKLEDRIFPIAEINDAGYQASYSGQKTYNGVAILSRIDAGEVSTGIPGFIDEQKRILAVTINEVRVVCVYVPNGQSLDSDKYQYKLRWLDALLGWLENEIRRYPRLALLGDYNIAPQDADVYDPSAWEGQVLCSGPERERFVRLMALGMKDAFRLFAQQEKSYSWWDYRMNAFRRNLGMRIDHILLSEELTEKCVSCMIDKSTRKLERPSDHAPVIVEIRD
ncbi:MAG: exodeoxyribonuclease III [Sulfuricella sp.]|nr:exodeoxyribonuclease III [Sulfuricella sp.]